MDLEVNNVLMGTYRFIKMYAYAKFIALLNFFIFMYMDEYRIKLLGQAKSKQAFLF